jgi:CHAT domain-containing protein
VARGATLAGLLLIAAEVATPARAVELPPVCAEFPAATDWTTPLQELRARADAQLLVSPHETVALMCATIPRVATEHGEDSIELAWWVGSLATPLIAFLDRAGEAIPLLEFARPRFEQHLGPWADELADIHVAYAWIAFRQGRAADSAASWERALAIREHNPGQRKVELQKALVGLAHARINLREFAAARAALERAEAILIENDETVSEAAGAIYNAFTNLAVSAEDYVTARHYAERQVETELALGGRTAQPVTAYALLGRILERLDEFEASERALREALRLSEAADGPFQRHRLPALLQLAAALAERGRPAEALPFATEAVTLGEAQLGPDAPRMVRIIGVLAEVQRALGHLPEALRLYQRAAAIVAASPAEVETPARMAHYRGFAALQASLGDPAAAHELLHAALAAAGADPTLATERGMTLLALATAPGAAPAGRREAELLEALALLRLRLPDSHPAILRVIVALCGLELERARPETPWCDEAAGRIAPPQQVEPGLRAAVLEELSRRAELRGEPREALQLATRALAAAATLGTPEPQWRAYFRLAELLASRTASGFPIFLGKQSIVEIERLRSYFAGEDRRHERGFLADKAAVYRQVADWLIAAGRMDEGLEVLALLKSEELHDFVLRGTALVTEGLRLELTEAEQQMQRELAAELAIDAAAGEEIARLSRLREADRISVEEQERLAALLAAQHSAEAARTARLEVLIAGSTARPAQPLPADSRRIAAALEPFGPHAVFGVYLLTDDHLRIIVASHAGQSEHRVAVDAPGLRREIGALLDAIRAREPVEARAAALYQLVAAPVDAAARAADAGLLVLWLDDALRYLPFDALHDGDGYLGERYAIQRYAEPGAAPGLATTVRRRPAVRGLGVTRAVAGFPALPAMADELCHVVNGPIAGLATPSKVCPRRQLGRGALRGEGYADEAFTAERLTGLPAGPGRYSVLHVGTHFSLRPGNALRSFLVLGDGERLTLDRVSELDFSGLELITLSACETGLAGSLGNDGREIEGLSALVQRRGASRVVGSLWKVEDESTALLMRGFYRALAEPGRDAASALHGAQRKLREQRTAGGLPYRHPYYWAGFFISGNRP